MFSSQRCLGITLYVSSTGDIKNADIKVTASFDILLLIITMVLIRMLIIIIIIILMVKPKMKMNKQNKWINR